jgi:hypothetical protein
LQEQMLSKRPFAVEACALRALPRQEPLYASKQNGRDVSNENFGSAKCVKRSSVGSTATRTDGTRSLDVWCRSLIMRMQWSDYLCGRVKAVLWGAFDANIACDEH